MILLLSWDEDDKLPHSNNSEFGDRIERRIAYVAITRPRTNLYMTWAAKEMVWRSFTHI